ncbi:MAG: hypothetical protein IJA67_04200 [Oscillospiraceae bacterium]|nr:hypothetical protein [Oscillospiraceae bacterium]
MSVKSRKGHAQKQNNQPNHSPLESQKQTIKAATTEYGITSIIFSFFVFVPLAFYWSEGPDSDPFGLYVGFLFLFCIWIFCLALFIRSLRIQRELGKIPCDTEEPVSIHCKKVSFLFKDVSLKDVHRINFIVCIVMQETNGNRFYYVYPENAAPDGSVMKNIKTSFTDRDLTLICYKGTNIVKALPKMPKYWPTLPEKREL